MRVDRNRLAVALAITATAAATATAARGNVQPSHPPTYQRPETETLHGQTLVDPFRWLENGDPTLQPARVQSTIGPSHWRRNSG